MYLRTYLYTLLNISIQLSSEAEAEMDFILFHPGHNPVYCECSQMIGLITLASKLFVNEVKKLSYQIRYTGT